ncbi:hypothetical protein [Streptomyces sp. NPDC058755]|uniref:hypothetical protein n=1 Tax=unclassified Streptomyces TaxID=2593676 RepID=UPI0036B37914
MRALKCFEQIQEDDADPWRVLAERLETVGQPNTPVRVERAAWTLSRLYLNVPYAEKDEMLAEPS